MVEIVAYQARWPAEFQTIAAGIRRTFGELALRIDHIGSTAVSGLPAKDVIDIQITVSALDAPVILAMTTLGYTQPDGVWRDHCPPTVVGPETEWEKLFFHPPSGQRRTNTHVRVQGRANQRYPLLFRDYLRTHRAMADAYAELKRRLAQYLADPETYPYVKDPAVDLIYFAAEDWASAISPAAGPAGCVKQPKGSYLVTERIPASKAELLADLEQTWTALNATFERLTAAQMTGLHDAAGWTVKDHITHLIVWERSALFFLQGQPRHAGLGVAEVVYLGGDEEQINAAILRAFHDMPLAAALAGLRDVHRQLLAALEPLTDADLRAPYRRYLPAEPGDGDGPPAIDVVYGNSANHYREHLPWIQALANQPA